MTYETTREVTEAERRHLAFAEYEAEQARAAMVKAYRLLDKVAALYGFVCATCKGKRVVPWLQYGEQPCPACNSREAHWLRGKP